MQGKAKESQGGKLHCIAPDDLGHSAHNGRLETKRMNNEMTFTSPQIAQKVARVFGTRVKTFKVPIRHRRVVGNFVRKIETAHKRAENSKLIFRA
ncbi:MAG: hypothetical protein PHI39_01735 [Kiritimatiellae bacterium]|nr:hypothetical protein [Kiritimatiellia bacterium]